MDLQVEEGCVARAIDIIGMEKNNHEKVEEITKGLGRLFRRSLGIGVLAAVLYAATHGFEEEVLVACLYIVPFATGCAMVALSFIFPQKS